MDPRLELYSDNVKNQLRRLPVRSRKELYMHFGHWEDASVAQVADFVSAQERLNHELLQLAGLSSSARLLDVGCGFGGTLAAINEKFTDVDMIGLNLDPRQIELARRAVEPVGNNRLEWVVGDATNLPFPDDRFDFVLAVESIIHFSRRRFLCEAARVLRPGGRLVVSDFVPTERLQELANTDSLPVPRAQVEELFASWSDFWGTDANYDALAEAAGLTLEQRIDATSCMKPSLAAILGDRVNSDPRDTGLDLETRSMLILQWAYVAGAIRMEYLAFART